jgi:general secretion pathway protein K
LPANLGSFLWSNPRASRGAALITAMLIVALATIAAVGMASRQRVSIHRAENILLADQAYLYLQGVESWALGVLQEDALNSTIDTLAEPWSLGIPVEAIQNGRVSGTLEDLQARFNLNNMVTNGVANNFEIQRMKRLLVILQLDPSLAESIVDWIDSDSQNSFPNGAEDDYYTALEQPYRAANRPMTHVSELRLIKGITDEVYKKMEPFLSTVPEKVPVNVNTASREVLATLAEGMNLSGAESLIATRETQPFTDTNRLLQHQAFAGIEIDGAGISLSSSYFLLRGETNLGRSHQVLSSVIRRTPNLFPVVWQRFSGEYAGGR